ncbi:hypothetical protein HEK616_21210 [Streptomyces nigrescens]|uniref:Uncharacterized protein n=1 Tax=Streptomyces nigrescens TaxID=1920 RepID=A0ABM7ZQK7_STRNI|nr:hypothetical protein [Streptomyces nigrescens]BDM68634.1 hypothetical protein HEK616_21210 [Streptomyces nigrescens]
MSAATGVSAPPGHRRLYAAARDEGPAAALRALLARHGPHALDGGAAGHAVLPEPAGPVDGRVLRHYPPPAGPVILVRRVPDAAPPAPPDPPALLWIRLGLTAGLRTATLDRLGERASGDGTILMHQLVKAQAAEAYAGELELTAHAASLAPAGATTARLRHLHSQITRTDRAWLRLLGAHGFLRTGPGGVAEVSELLADVYLPAEEER